MALFVSKYNHCLYDILGRYSAGELNVEIPLIISNHMDLKPIANQFNIPFFHVLSLRTTKNQEKSNKSNYSKARDQLYCSGPLHANHNTKFNFALRK
jgi:formyltetrahydrofolate hydrolase